MKQYITVIAVAIVAAVCLFLGYRYQYYYHKEPPPGYCVLVDESGTYFFTSPQSWDPKYLNDLEFEVSKSHQGAINEAWDDWRRHHRSSVESLRTITPSGELKEVQCNQ